MTVYRGRKQSTTSPSPLPHHETQQQPTNGSSTKYQSKPRSSGSNGIIHLHKSTSSVATRRSARRRATTILIIFLFITVAGSVYLSYCVLMKDVRYHGANPQQTIPEQQPNKIPAKTQLDEGINDNNKKRENSSDQINHDKCEFRSYPSTRLYGLPTDSPPKFLSEAAYIRGQRPIVINPHGNDNIQQTTAPVKVCLDTTSWENLIDKDGRERLPFTDGHNPSVISLASNPYSVSASDNSHIRLDPTHLGPIASMFPSNSLNAMFLGVTIFGGGQCKFGFSPEDVDKYRFSLYDEPPGGKRAVIAVLAPPNSDGSPSQQSPFQTLAQTTLLLERDAKYGKNRRAIQAEKTDSGFARMHQEFDDPRLFFHLGRVWILYRNGPLFGYNDQIHNPIHFEEVPSGGEDNANNVKFVAYVKASETVLVSGGRNIALISEEPIGRNGNGEVEWVSSPSLKALTWVDPVTVIDVKTDDIEAKLKNRRLQEVVGRRKTKPTKSHIHGTNGYLVPLASTGELLGIAHFHRPEDRKKSDYALHGHHYTHALFTIARQADENNNDINSRPFKLKRLSNEFVFRANYIPVGSSQPPKDGDIIQFASGLDVVGSDIDGQLIISYGINDCEGAVFTLAMQKVQQIMLVEVTPGQEVVDVMTSEGGE